MSQSLSIISKKIKILIAAWNFEEPGDRIKNNSQHVYFFDLFDRLQAWASEILSLLQREAEEDHISPKIILHLGSRVTFHTKSMGESMKHRR